ncbi:MAG: hypothetical protein CL746_05435 [Chloroflexi bacterium]|nr:hypothetical protein [Chloroflexota bacterium]|tara:strand:+ start:289 stop:1932 length:1644 start_codon:yes stop_codon:yes gene_type:complete
MAIKGNIKLNSLDSSQLINAIESFSVLLNLNIETINALNVFPVPDGDTGTNMYLSIKYILENLNDEDSEKPINSLAKDIAKLSLLGARGNSGLILSQFFKGLSQSLENKNILDSNSFAKCLEYATKNAYDSLPNPVEGTMITVFRECADQAKLEIIKNSNLSELISNVTKTSIESVRNTPKLLPVLDEADVIDSGGFGFLVILTAFSNFINQDKSPMKRLEVPMPDSKSFTGKINKQFLSEHELDEWGFCTTFSVETNDKKLDLKSIQKELELIGKSVAVDAMENILKIHVHVENSDTAIIYGKKLGKVSNIEIGNMDKQFFNMKNKKLESQYNYEIITFASGEGIAELIDSAGWGITKVIRLNKNGLPSISEILEVINNCESDNIILITNNPNLIATTNQINELTKKIVKVIPTKNEQEGVSALFAFNPDSDININSKLMEESYMSISSGYIAKSSRNVTLNNIDIKKDMYFGILDKIVHNTGKNKLEVLNSLINDNIKEEKFITIFSKDKLNNYEVEEIEDLLSNYEIEIIYGGQLLQDFLISAE